MCGEVFSSKYTPEQKSSPSLAKPHPLARPGRWSVVFDNDDRAFFDQDDGFASEADAKAATRRAVGTDSFFKVIPPAETFGDHDPTLLSREQLERLARAILNNDQASFEALRPELAAASSPKPAKPTRTRAAVASAIVAFLTDDSGLHGNPGDFVDDAVEEFESDDSVAFIGSTLNALAELIREYRASSDATDDAPARAVVKFLGGEDCVPGDLGEGQNNCVHPDDPEDVAYSFDVDDSAELRRLVLAAR